MSASSAIPPRLMPLVRLGLFIAVYAVAARMGSLLSFAPEHVSAMWPPSGVALAVLTLSPVREWPWLMLAAVALEPVVTAEAHWPVGPAHFAIACGNMLEAGVGALLLRRAVRLHPAMNRVRDALGLCATALSSPALSASVGVATLVLAGRLTWANAPTVWRVFWVGDAMGILVVAPLLFTWNARRGATASRQRPWELALLLVALGAATHAVFRAAPSTTTSFHPLSYLAFPFLLWAALRFDARGAATATAVLSAVSLWHTSLGSGPFAGPQPNLNLSFLQSFLAAASVSGLMLAGALGERRRAQDEVSHLNTELRQSLDRLAATQAALVRRERMAALGELSATVAHEVRNPLGAIANALAAFRRMHTPPPGSTADTLLAVMDEEVHRLDHIVNDMLDFTRPMEPRLQAQSLEPLVEGALTSALRTGPPGLEVVRDLDAALPPAAVDAQLLHVALTNLFHNALQAMSAGGTLTVRLTSDLRGGTPHARLSISDTGHGISPELQARVFEPFFTTRATGTGLGLAIVRRIVDSHHGTVAVHSLPGQGTTFTLWLPYLGPALDAVA
ncbi:MASE1 domain-containing protein [Myxococcaceae bacterium JPH2]|nr:MASE1 domain-containing protein [Myxococcaceae bacterium JPH2]